MECGERGNLYTEATLIIGGFGALDGLVVIPTESAIAVLVVSARKRRYGIRN